MDKQIKYELWQMPLSNLNKFMPLSRCRKRLNSNDYVLVYDGVTCELDDTEHTLECLFERFNTRIPHDYHATPLSISDVICLFEDGERKYYYIDDRGFTELKWFETCVKREGCKPPQR